MKEDIYIPNGESQHDRVRRPELIRLARTQEAYCASIYLPVAQTGAHVDLKQLQTRLGKAIAEMTRQLEVLGLRMPDIREYVLRLERMRQDKDFLMDQNTGLAIFLHRQAHVVFKVPIAFREQVYVADHFYLLPLIPVLPHNGTFFVLRLGMRNVQLYKGGPDHLKQINTGKLLPESFEAVTGTDFKDTSNQHHTTGPGKVAHVHGHGEGKDDRKAEILKYFRAVDAGVVRILHNETAPMLVACLDQHFPLYATANTYHGLYNAHIGGNPRDVDVRELLEKARQVLEAYFQAPLLRSKAQFAELAGTGRTSSAIGEIVRAAFRGQVATMFVDPEMDCYGVFDQLNASLIIDSEKIPGNASILNLAAAETLLRQGDVFALPAAQMPVPNSAANAIYRYA